MPTRQTLVFVHAHPDDEALLTAGTMSRAAAEGHRVVLVVATDGGAGRAADAEGLGARRRAELEASAAILGVHRVEWLGYRDSGLRGEHRDGFAFEDDVVVATRIAAIVDEEGADVLVGYDASGGYGHPDHVQVHRVTRVTAALARRTPRLFEATYPRERLVRAVRLAARLRLTTATFRVDEFDSAWMPRREITHQVDIRRYLPAKWAALRAHASQAAGGDRVRTLALLLSVPSPLRWFLGTEFYRFVCGPPNPAILWLADRDAA